MDKDLPVTIKLRTRCIRALVRTDYFLQTRSEDLYTAKQSALKKEMILLSNDIIHIRHILFHTKQSINSLYFSTLPRNS